MIFILDFDGTLATEDTVDQLLEHHADPAWQDLEADWLDGRISALECMQAQVRLVRGDHITLGNFFRTIRLDPHFAAFRKHVGAFAHLAVVSDGLDFAIHTALRHAGVDNLPVYANQLHFVSPDRLELTFPHRNAECGGGNGVCKCAIARQLAARHGGPIVLVGDGKSDACLAGIADVVFAKGSLIGHCEARGIPHTPIRDFGDVLNAVREWDFGKRQSATF
ncbi:MAG TPA: HAD-IB family phosphatase [Rhodocyclaceae bacterium]|nr:HAD-IB family phosphatase [Rhodocyclaceae bacterium]